MQTKQMAPSLREPSDLSERGRQKLGKVGIGHFAGCHRKLTMFDRATTTDMPIDPHVVWRVSKDHLGPIMR
jgi:hypothetical protein